MANSTRSAGDLRPKYHTPQTRCRQVTTKGREGRQNPAVYKNWDPRNHSALLSALRLGVLLSRSLCISISVFFALLFKLSAVRCRLAFCFPISDSLLSVLSSTCPFGQFQTAQSGLDSLLLRCRAENNMDSTLLPPTRSKFYFRIPIKGGPYNVVQATRRRGGAPRGFTFASSSVSSRSI